MSTTPQPASPEPAPRPAEAAETTDAATPPTDAPETEATPQAAPAAPDDRSSSDEADGASRPEDADGSEPGAESKSGAEPESGPEPESDAESEDEGESEEERRRSAEEFAAEHDPANHDIAAGEEFRQPGDWTAEDGGPQVWDSEGNLVSGGGESGDDETDSSEKDSAGTDSDETEGGDNDETESAGDAGGADGRRVSALEEVRDGGYSVGSAATMHDGAMPFGHPVKAWEDTKTFVTQEHDQYEEAEPHVWFADAEAAERAGFRPAD